MQDKIKKHIKELRQTVMAASFNYDIWWTYKEQNSRAKYIDVMNDYLEFFRTSIHAHFVTLLVALYRFYEKRKDTINIWNLISLLEKENKFQEKLIEIKRDLENRAVPSWRKVSILRNKAFCHLSNSLGVTHVFQEAQVKPEELKDLIEITKSLLNKITYLWDRSDLPNLSALHDTVKLLDDLNELKNIRLEKKR